MMAALRFGDGTTLRGWGARLGWGTRSDGGPLETKSPLCHGGPFRARGPLRDRLGSSQTNHLEHMTSPRRSPLCLLPAHPEGQTLAGGGQEDLSPSWHPVWVPRPSTGLRGHLDLGAPFGSGEDTGAPLPSQRLRPTGWGRRLAGTESPGWCGSPSPLRPWDLPSKPEGGGFVAVPSFAQPLMGACSPHSGPGGEGVLLLCGAQKGAATARGGPGNPGQFASTLCSGARLSKTPKDRGEGRSREPGTPPGRVSALSGAPAPLEDVSPAGHLRSHLGQPG